MRSVICSVHALGIALLLGAAFASTGTIGSTARITAGWVGSDECAAHEATILGRVRMFGCPFRAVDGSHSANSLSNRPASALSTIVFDPLQSGSTDGAGHEHDKAPTSVPAPLTALLFGTALLIGGGLLRRRQRAWQHSIVAASPTVVLPVKNDPDRANAELDGVASFKVKQTVTAEADH